MIMYESNNPDRFTSSLYFKFCDECGSTNIKVDRVIEKKKDKKTTPIPSEKG